MSEEKVNGKIVKFMERYIENYWKRNELKAEKARKIRESKGFKIQLVIVAVLLTVLFVMRIIRYINLS
jgi:hypothetical protein